MLDFYKVNFEVKLRQKIGQICETIKIKAMSCLATMKAAYSKDVCSRFSSSFIRCDIKMTKNKKIHTYTHTHTHTHTHTPVMWIIEK